MHLLWSLIKHWCDTPPSIDLSFCIDAISHEPHEIQKKFTQYAVLNNITGGRQSVYKNKSSFSLMAFPQTYAFSEIDLAPWRRISVRDNLRKHNNVQHKSCIQCPKDNATFTTCDACIFCFFMFNCFVWVGGGGEWMQSLVFWCNCCLQMCRFCLDMRHFHTHV